MNINALARMYDRLTARERLPLLLAAEGRGDDAEYRRLADAAPVTHMRFADYLWPSLRLNVLALIYLTEQLDALASYWHSRWRLADPDDPDPPDWELLADCAAYFFAANAEAWRRFGAELHIDADALARGNYRGWLLEYCADRLPNVAPTREDLQARLRAQGTEATDVIGVEELLASWRRLHAAEAQPR